MTGLLDQYKKDQKFLKMIKQMSISADLIEDIMTQMNKEYPPPDDSVYDFNLQEKKLRIIKKK